MESKHSTIDFMGYTLTVEYDHYPYHRGAMRDGLQIEPDEPASIEITLIQINGMEITGLLIAHLDDIEEEIKIQSGEF